VAITSQNDSSEIQEERHNLNEPALKREITAYMSGKTLTQHTWRVPELMLWCLLFVLFTNVFGVFTPIMPGPGRMEPTVLDSRLPSLEDGLSWPAILDNYTVAGTDNDWIYLTRKAPPIKTVSRYTPLGKVAASLGEEVPVPAATGPVFVEVDAKLSIFGKMMAVLYKPSSLNLRVTMRNGQRSVYRVNANMMETGFVLSPLVTTNEGFLELFDPNAPPRDKDEVQSIALDVSGGRTSCWNKVYTVTFKQYEY